VHNIQQNDTRVKKRLEDPNEKYMYKYLWGDLLFDDELGGLETWWSFEASDWDLFSHSYRGLV